MNWITELETRFTYWMCDSFGHRLVPRYRLQSHSATETHMTLDHLECRRCGGITDVANVVCPDDADADAGDDAA